MANSLCSAGLRTCHCERSVAIQKKRHEAMPKMRFLDHLEAGLLRFARNDVENFGNRYIFLRPPLPTTYEMLNRSSCRTLEATRPARPDFVSRRDSSHSDRLFPD